MITNKRKKYYDLRETETKFLKIGIMKSIGMKERFVIS